MVVKAKKERIMDNSSHRPNHWKLAGFIMFMLIAICILISIVFYQIVNRPEPEYFATSIKDEDIPLVSLKEPILSPNELLQWAHRAAIAAYTYDFVNSQKSMQQLKIQFTDDGWRYYESAMNASQTLTTVIDKKLVVSAVATGTPVITDQSVISGRYTWKVQIPLLVTYLSPSEQTQQSMVVTIIISRVPTTDIPKGIAIISFVSSAS